MRSMTGFGIGEASVGVARVSVELRSVNHKFCDVRVRLPQELVDYTFFVEQIARRRLGRGRFDVNVRITGTLQTAPIFVVERLKQLYTSVCMLRDELAPDSTIPLASLLSAPGVFVSSDPSREHEMHQALQESMTQAIDSLEAMRIREGESLRAVLQAQLIQTRELVNACTQKTNGTTEVYRARLRERLARLLADTRTMVDEARLEQEIALLADRTDATEELNRLASHLDHFESYLSAPDPVGRRLDFLLQEIAREANTLGAKCQDSELALLVVELRAEAERMREQVQNVE